MLVRMDIVGSNNDVIPFANRPVANLVYGRLRGGTGFGVSPVQLQWFEGASDGALFRGSRKTTRPLRIPIAVFGSTRPQVESALRRLSKAIRGVFTLRLTYGSGEVFSLPVVYSAGLEVNFEDHRRRGHLFRDLELIAPDPYFTSQSTTQFTWQDTVEIPFLETLTLSSSTLTGDQNVLNPGDVAARPTWVVSGPVTKFSVDVQGSGFVWDDDLEVDETLRISYNQQAGSWSVKDGTGENRLSGLQFGSVFPLIQPGNSVVSLSVEGTTSATLVQMFFSERREVIY